MFRYGYFQGVLSAEESASMHSALARDYREIIGRHRSDIQFDDILLGDSLSRMNALTDLAIVLKDRVPDFTDFDSDKWRATVNQWSSARHVGEQRLRPHRDRVGCSVAVTSLNGLGRFCINRRQFNVSPGDVVVMNNKWLPPKHSVEVLTDERMSVAMWNAYR